MRPRSAYIIAASAWAIQELIRWSCGEPNLAIHYMLSANTYAFAAWGFLLSCLELVEHIAKRAAEVSFTIAATWLILANQRREVLKRLNDSMDLNEHQCNCGSRKKFKNCHGDLRRRR